MRILIDCDDVLEELLTTWVAYLNERYDLSVDVNDINSWDLSEYYPTLTNKEIYSCLEESELWRAIPVKKGAQETLKTLIAEGHDVVIVTSGYYKNLYPKFEYIFNRYFDFIDYDNIIITYRKDLIRGDVLIDDYYENLKNFKGYRILFTSPHNREINADNFNAIRVDDWDECYKLLKIIDIFPKIS